MLTTKLHFLDFQGPMISRGSEHPKLKSKKHSCSESQRNQWVQKILKNFVLFAKEPHYFLVGNPIELTKIIMRSDGKNREVLIENITSSSILTWQHVNMHGTYDFTKFQSNNDNEFKYEEIKKYKIA